MSAVSILIVLASSAGGISTKKVKKKKGRWP